MKTPVTKFLLLNVFAALILFSPRAFAQQGEFSVGFGYSQPVKEMAQELKSGPTSIVFSYGKKLWSSPFIIGVSTSMGSYQSVKTREPFSHYGYQHEEADFRINYSTRTSLVYLRFFPKLTDRVSPFVEGAIGYNRFETNWVAKDPYRPLIQNYSSCQSPSDLGSGNLSRETALTYGVGGGFRYKIMNKFYFESSVMMMLGKTATYLTEKKSLDCMDHSGNNTTNSRYQSATAVYAPASSGYSTCDATAEEIAASRVEFHRSTTDMLTFKAGFVISFE